MQGPQSIEVEGGQEDTSGCTISRNLEEELWLSMDCELLSIRKIDMKIKVALMPLAAFKFIMMHICVIKSLLESRSRNELDIKADKYVMSENTIILTFLPKTPGFSFLSSHQVNLHCIRTILIYIKIFRKLPLISAKINIIEQNFTERIWCCS
jgi:hypothetical protein